ncbi:hypothetical protein LAC81_03055 [Ensifer adhaerens]|nr:hypothetical protein [Ensifer adhaerens]MBZ7920767.1 hypothetical protein [Ensifer adhaerens]UAX93225.1 hypothetical protein LAC78_03050 [Ensifer adhaerens]UAY00862.1 hypothetical protein LAC80_03055 [Ensifer adhaerens]UAY08243.1 hypothetical protein LAC81_03055 [Ensifer adhaerens]
MSNPSGGADGWRWATGTLMTHSKWFGHAPKKADAAILSPPIAPTRCR